MSNRHTPGPWKFGYTDNLEYPIIIGADDEIVCVMREGVSTKDGKLLAMGPELLEALKLIASAENSALDLAYCKGIARAAIAKATGGPA
jgi:hypothetical protein